MAEYVNITLDAKDGVGKLILNRPAALNAINFQTLVDLDNVCTEIESGDHIRALVIGAVGRGFCTGADLRDAKDSAGSSSGDAMARYWQRVFTRLEDLPVPTIAAIQGYCLAGGLELALCCDFRFIADNATIGDQHARYGLMPGGGGSQRLPRLIGVAKAKELIYTGDWLPPPEALSIGLVSRVVPADELMDACEAYATKLAKKSPVAMRLVKGLINRALQVDLQSGLELEQMAVKIHTRSEDAHEGFAAFLEKREPVFKGR